MGNVFFECAWFDSPSSCYEEQARFTSDALSAGALCSATSCEELEPCLDANLWSYGEPR
jgi:hypothetical protein